MRLLQLQHDGEFSLVEYVGNNIPRYAILSHTWGPDKEEVTFRDLIEGRGKNKTGYQKLTFCGKQAARDGLQYFWVDSCCIDKSSSAELQEAINSMFRWYRNAERCYVYLSDVLYNTANGDDECSRRWKPTFKKSKWFTRGWTLQELIAPESVDFFSKEGILLGNKQSLEGTVHEITGIAIKALQGSPLSHFSIRERMSWAANRETKREEDIAYSLLGIFDIYMPLIYGEGKKNALTRLEEQIEKTSRDRTPLDNEQRGKLLESLRFDQIDARRMNIKNAHANTCKWLLRKSEYLDWLDATKLGAHHGFLWIRGKPGTGKSTLMKFALTNAPKTIKADVVISFFFNARGKDIEKSTIGTYRSLLFQLLERLPALQRVFDSLSLSPLSISTHYQWSVESLKMLLEQAIQGLKESTVCFIDALDECEEWQIRDMIQFFEHLGELAVSSGVRFQVCFSSRHYPHITIQKGIGLVLEGQEGHTQDITSYLESELRIGHSKVAQQIRTELQEKAAGIFMWVVLVVGILNKEYDGGRIHALRRRLQEIPGDLHQLFSEILTRDSDNRDELVLCVQWVLFSRQPLSPQQLYFAILSGVEPDALSRWDPDEIPGDVIERFVLNSSKGLAEITRSWDPTVQFIHESVRDFFLKENELGRIWPDLKSNFEGRSHEQLKYCCLNYMDIDNFTDLEKTAAFPFIRYAVGNVLYHADVAAGNGIDQGNFIRDFPYAKWIKLDNLFPGKHKHTENVSLLYVLAEGNMSNLIRIHPSIFSCLEVEKERYGPPLFAALATGSDEAVRTFMEVYTATQPPESWLHNQGSRYLHNQYSWYRYYQAGQYRHNAGSRFRRNVRSRYRHYEYSRGRFGPNFEFSKQRTTLSYLAELGDEVIFALGLEIGKITPNSKDQDGQTPLSWAAGEGHEAVVELLLDKDGVDVDSKDDSGWAPLSYAAANGHERVVKLLLETGKADVNSKDKDGQTPLSLAAGNGYGVVVKLLLDEDEVDVNSKDGSGQKPPWWTAKHGHEAVTKLLLDVDGVDLNPKDSKTRGSFDYGRTPLSLAARFGHTAVVKLLLDKNGVDVNAKDDSGWAPLSYAAANGHHRVVKLFLDKDGVDVDLKDDEYGRTPLLFAAEYGNQAVVKLLLAGRGVDVNSKDGSGRTPLWLAAMYGHEEVLKLLLHNDGVDVNSKDGSGRTLLWWVARYGREELVKLLLDKDGVDADSKDNNGRTPLSFAAGSGYEAVVKLLLDKDKVDVNSKDSMYRRTPLSYAAGNGHEAVVKLLLDMDGVDLNPKDSKARGSFDCGRTPLSFAARFGHTAVVKLLLDKDGVDVDSKDDNGWTPLSYAVRNGHEAVAKLLLDKDGVDADSKDNNGRTPLSFAAGSGYEAVVKLLLDKDRADADSKDNSGWTPLSYAAGNGYEAVVKLLLDRDGVDVDSKDRDGQTPLSKAVALGCESVVVLLLNKDRVDINSKDSSGYTPLWWAAMFGRKEVVRLLLDKDEVDVDSKDNTYGRTPLSFASGNGNEAVVKLLLKTGKADVNSKDRDGQTPLSLAAGNGHEAIVRLLQSRHNLSF